jgi:predicted CoA-binding protein
MEKQTVAILGASHKPERYAHKAMIALLEAGHKVILINPGLKEIEGIPCVRSISDITEKVDTLTLYVGREMVEKLSDAIIAIKPGRIIANPGTETEMLKEKAAKNKIDYIEACTLVMLKTEQF